MYETGVYFDSALRTYEETNREVVEFARREGFEVPTTWDLNDADVLNDATDRAIDFLNDECRDSAHTFWGFEEGDFGLFEYEDDADDFPVLLEYEGTDE